MSTYETFGPFHLKREGHRLASGAFEAFWKAIDADEPPGLGEAIGVYIFSTRSLDETEFVPWYVGRTDRLGFRKRLNQHELRLRQVLERSQGELQIFLLAFMAPAGTRFRRRSKTKISHNDWLESMIIGSALSSNPSLINASKVKNSRSLVVPGYLNTPPEKLTSSALALRSMLHASRKAG